MQVKVGKFAQNALLISIARFLYHIMSVYSCDCREYFDVCTCRR